MVNDIFVYATRNKLRFSTIKGEMGVEQLWDIPLRSRDNFNLDVIAKSINRALKDVTEESFVDNKRTPQHTHIEVSLELVKFVISAKLDDEQAAARRAENKQKKEKLLAALDKKQDEKLDGLTIKDIQKQLAALED
jgi:hypothetical protein